MTKAHLPLASRVRGQNDLHCVIHDKNSVIPSVLQLKSLACLGNCSCIALIPSILGHMLPKGGRRLHSTALIINMWEIRNLDWAKRGEVPSLPVDCYQTVNLYIVARCKKRAENTFKIQKPAKTRRYIIPDEGIIDLEALVTVKTRQNMTLCGQDRSTLVKGMQDSNMYKDVHSS